MLGIFMLLGAGAVAMGSSVSRAARRNEYEFETSKAEKAQAAIRAKTLNPHIEEVIFDELMRIKANNTSYTETLVNEVEEELNYIFKDKWKTSEDKIEWYLNDSTLPMWMIIQHLLLAKKGVLWKKAVSEFVVYEISEFEKLECDKRFVQMIEKRINESTGLDITWVYKSYYNNTGTPTLYGGGFLIKECLPSYMLSGTARLWLKGDYK